MEILFRLFLVFLKIGAFSFGGGYAMLPFIETEVVENNHWLTQTEFLDIIGISQATPGPIAINTATFVGYRTGGVLGSAVATMGVILVSFCLVIIASHFMKKFEDSILLKNALTGMRPALVAMILSSTVTTARTAYFPFDLKAVFIGGATLWLLIKTKLHPILTIVLAAGMGLVLYGLL